MSTCPTQNSRNQSKCSNTFNKFILKPRNCISTRPHKKPANLWYNKQKQLQIATLSSPSLSTLPFSLSAMSISFFHWNLPASISCLCLWYYLHIGKGTVFAEEFSFFLMYVRWSHNVQLHLVTCGSQFQSVSGCPGRTLLRQKTCGLSTAPCPNLTTVPHSDCSWSGKGG